jgi:hypothetical protein
LARARSDGPDRVVAVLSDFFCGLTQPLATELGVPRITFSPSAVYGTTVLHSLFRRMPRREDEDDDKSLLPRPQIPDAPAYPSRQLSLLYRTLKDGGEVSEGVKRNFLWNLESSAFVPNSFWRLEECYLRAPLADSTRQPLLPLTGQGVKEQWRLGARRPGRGGGACSGGAGPRARSVASGAALASE